jgi:Ca-activated chloride channel family protein
VSFIWPTMLLLLLAVPLGALYYVARERRRRGRLSELGTVAVAAGHPASTSVVRRRLPSVLMLVGLTILVMALARPQSVIGVPRFEGTVILSFDVSGSMAAEDVAPTRMEAAKAAARSFVARQPPSILVGVTAFSDAGFSTLVPTDEEGEILAAIDRLGPERGTSVARGIIASLTAIAVAERDTEAGYYTNRSPDPAPLPPVVPAGTDVPAVIVLLTDGENNIQPDPLAAAAAAAERGVRVFTVGVGTEAGTTLEVDGFVVHSRLDEPTLRAIAEITGGEYYAAENPSEIASIYDQIATRLVIKPEAQEITSLFAGAGILVLALGGLAGLRWLGRLP